MKQDIEKKDKLIAVLKQANASLIRANNLERQDEVLKPCQEMLKGHPEGMDVHDISGETDFHL